MKKSLQILCVLLLILGFCFLIGCAEKGDTATAEEIAAVQNAFTDRGYGIDNFQTYVLYNAKERPAYLMGVSDDGCIICRRKDFKFCEYNGTCPYLKYLDVKKYYAEPMSYVIRAEDVIGGEENPDGEFFYLMNSTYGSFKP